jgi:hypothetical protein
MIKEPKLAKKPRFLNLYRDRHGTLRLYYRRPGRPACPCRCRSTPRLSGSRTMQRKPRRKRMLRLMRLALCPRRPKVPK